MAKLRYNKAENEFLPYLYSTLKTRTLFVFILLVSVNMHAQELDEFAAADADFFAKGKYYQSIYPIIRQRHEWKDWETNYDSAQKANRILRVRGESMINLVYVTGADENGNDQGDTLTYNGHHLHFLDYNGDGLEDLIFEQQVSTYRGHVVKFYSGDGNYYNLEYQFVGMVVAFGQSEVNNAFWFTLYDYPCCDGYIHTLESFEPMVIGDGLKYQLSKVEKYIESNAVNRQRKNLPNSFSQNTPFRTDSEVVILYYDTRPIYQKFSPESGYTKQLKTYHPFAMIPAQSTGIVLNQTQVEHSGNEDTLLFVKFKIELSPSKAIRHLGRESKNTRSNQLEQVDTTTYYGWLNKRDVILPD